MNQIFKKIVQFGENRNSNYLFLILFQIIFFFKSANTQIEGSRIWFLIAPFSLIMLAILQLKWLLGSRNLIIKVILLMLIIIEIFLFKPV